MQFERNGRARPRGRVGIAAALAVAALATLGGCNGQGDRAGQEVKEDVRGMRDFLYGRGITIDTRLPER